MRIKSYCHSKSAEIKILRVIMANINCFKRSFIPAAELCGLVGATSIGVPLIMVLLEF